MVSQPKKMCIQDDPLYFMSFVHKFVQIKTLDDKIYQGTVFTVDPTSDNVVLISHIEGKPCVDIIMGHVIRSIQPCGQPSGFTIDSSIGDKLFKGKEDPSDDILSTEEVAKRKQQLKNWLTKNLISVFEEGDLLKLDDILVIHPPYGVNQCSCSNQIVLGKVQALISKMSLDS